MIYLDWIVRHDFVEISDFLFAPQEPKQKGGLLFSGSASIVLSYTATYSVALTRKGNVEDLIYNTSFVNYRKQYASKY